MFETLITALLPIVVTLMLGYAAGWHHDFNADQSAILNRMVMLYALPMSLFVGILGTPRSVILSNAPMFLWLTVGMIGGLIVVYALSRYLFKRDVSTAALQALAIAGPAVPFVGVSVLGTLFGTQSSLAIAISSLLMNLIQVPLCMVFLSYGAAKATDAKASGKPGSSTTSKTPKTPEMPDRQGGESAAATFKTHIVSALKEPVVWAPLTAFVLVMLGVRLSVPLQDSFNLLGKATGGVALFASGAILYSQKVGFSMPVGVNVLGKNILLPVVVWLAMKATGTAANIQNIVLLTLAIPTASIAVILSVQYKTAEREIASTLFFSTLASIVTMGIFIWLTHA